MLTPGRGCLLFGVDEPVVIERALSERGELVLRKRGDVFELISGGVFLMDSDDVRSEEALVRCALDRVRRPSRVLIGGLGFGASLHECLRDPRVEAVTVIEIEPAVAEWYPKYFRGAPDDRVTIVEADAAAWLLGQHGRYDVICLDVDNGPDWRVHPANAALYSYRGLRALRRTLAEGGCLSFWSGSASPRFEGRLREVFPAVSAERLPARTGPEDVIYLAQALTRIR